MTPWDTQCLFTELPTVHAVVRRGNLRGVYYSGEPFDGKATRVFAWLGVPENTAPRVPGMVLLHGGGGRAFPQWVEQWVRRGYAAIAMDFGGCGPDGKRHAHAGPEQSHAAKFDLGVGWDNLWTYHAVAAAIRGHTLLRQHAEVDPDRIGVTGISWGGYLACIMAGVDTRLKLAVPVYGCGCLQHNSCDEWMAIFAAMTRDERDQWQRRCDPASYLPNATMPMLFTTGTNDFAYPLDSLRRSSDLVHGDVQFCIRLEMPHGHEAGWAPCEIARFAGHILGDEPGLPRFESVRRDGTQILARVKADVPVRQAWVLSTRDCGRWQDRVWQQAPARIEESRLHASVHPAVSAWFLAAEDDLGGYGSSRPEVT